jgi:hypothetical protein
MRRREFLAGAMSAASLPAVDAPENAPAPHPGISPLQQMAARIARNREVLGLHYPSDSKAGRQLAIRTLDISEEVQIDRGSDESQRWTSLRRQAGVVTRHFESIPLAACGSKTSAFLPAPVRGAG